MKTNKLERKNIFKASIIFGLFIGLCACSSNKMANIGCGYGYENNEMYEERQSCEDQQMYIITSKN